LLAGQEHGRTIPLAGIRGALKTHGAGGPGLNKI
jgi:hypothetical protein